MNDLTRRRAASLGLIAAAGLTVAGPVTVAAQAAAAPAPAPAPLQTQGLLDPILGVVTGLTGALSGLLSPTALTNLTGVTTTLTGSGVATPTSLQPLQDILASLAANNTLPVDTKALLSQVSTLTDAAGAGNQVIPVTFLAPIQSLVAQLAGTSGLSVPQTTALNGLVSALTSIISSATGGATGIGGLPIGSLPLDLTNLTGLTAVLGQLQTGVAPSGTELGPVAAILNQVAATPGLPAPVSAVIGQVADQLNALTGPITAPLVAPVGQLLTSVANTPGVPSQLRSTLTGVAGLLGTGTPSSGTSGGGSGSGSGGNTPSGGGATYTPGSGGGTPSSGLPAGSKTGGGAAAGGGAGAGGGSGAGAARASYRAPRLTGVRFDRAKRAIVLSFSCASGSTPCASLVGLTSGSRSVATGVLVQLASGTSLKRTVKLNASARSTLKRKRQRVTITAATSRTQSSTRTLTLPRIP